MLSPMLVRRATPGSSAGIGRRIRPRDEYHGPTRPKGRVRTMNGMRLVSLLPSATEIVYALGLEDDLVGVTFECDEPARARRDKTVVVGGRDTRGMTPDEIDDYVKER